MAELRNGWHLGALRKGGLLQLGCFPMIQKIHPVTSADSAEGIATVWGGGGWDVPPKTGCPLVVLTHTVEKPPGFKFIE